MEAPDPRLGTTIDGRYRLDQVIGAGGMGVVYKGEQLGLAKPVAVKFLHDAMARLPDLVKRFRREATMMSRLAHPHLVSIIDSGVQGEVPYLVMDFCQGHSLSTVIERGAVPPVRAVAIARQVLAGVGNAHSTGVVHRDLKPDNILLLDDVDGDFVKILDFGLAKAVHGDGGDATQLTTTGLAMGTPGHMAPEQVKGLPTDERCDVYAVGTILYQMVVGKKPFTAESPLAVLRMQVDDPPVPPRKAAPDAKLSAELETVILRAMEKPREKRWQSAEAFARALDSTPEGRSREKTPSVVDISMEEIPGATAVGHKAAPRGTGLAAARKEPQMGASAPSRVSALLRERRRPLALGAFVLIALAGGAFAWSRLSHKRQEEVRQQLKVAQDWAKSTGKAISSVKEELPKLLPQPAKPPPDDDDDDTPPAPSRDTPGAKLEASAHAGKVPIGAAKRAARLIAAGKVDEAMPLLYALRRQSPKSELVARLLGHAYFRKGWRTDGLREYASALEWRPQARSDKLLVKNAVAALDDPTSRAARAVIRNHIGTAALPELRRAARSAKSSLVQKRAARLVAELQRVAHAKGHH
jgi:serine/threonine-protein kinase